MKQFNIYEDHGPEHEPTKKEAKKAVKAVKATPVKGETKDETIEFEKNLSKKTPRKNYAGGKRTAAEVDTEAAKEEHKRGIRQAGKDAVAANNAEREKLESYRALGHRLDELIQALAPALRAGGKIAATGLKAGGKMAVTGLKAAGRGIARGAKELGREAARGAGEAVANKALNQGEQANAGEVHKKKLPTIVDPQKLARDSRAVNTTPRSVQAKGDARAAGKLNQSTQYDNAYVSQLMESRSSLDLRRDATQRQAKERRNEAPESKKEAPESKKEAPKLTPQQKANRAAYDRGEHPKKPKEENTAYHTLGRLYLEMCQTCKDDGTAAAKEAPEGKKHVAYNKARRSAENKRHGKSGETPRQTQVRRHGGGGIPAETKDVAKADAAHSRKKVQDAGDR